MSSTSPPFSGIWPAMVTPYNGNHEVHTRAIETLVGRLIEEGAAGLFVGGSTGEGILLSVAERKLLTEVSVKAAGAQIPIMVHVGANQTRDAVELAIHARKAGAAAVSCVAPIYYPVDPATAFAYYREVAEAGELPFYCYVFRGQGLESFTIRQFIDELLKLPNAAGVKFTHFRMDDIARMKIFTDGKLNVLSGYDECFLAAKMQGADGAVGSFYNAFLPHWESIRKNAETGKFKRARDQMLRAVGLVTRLLPYGLDGLKHVLRLKGIETGTVRGPLPRLSEQQKREVRDAFESFSS